MPVVAHLCPQVIGRPHAALLRDDRVARLDRSDGVRAELDPDRTAGRRASRLGKAGFPRITVKNKVSVAHQVYRVLPATVKRCPVGRSVRPNPARHRRRPSRCRAAI